MIFPHVDDLCGLTNNVQAETNHQDHAMICRIRLSSQPANISNITDETTMVGVMISSHTAEF